MFRIGYVNQENNVGNWLYNYIKLINSLIQVAINFLERHMDTYRIRVILFSGIQFRTGYQNQAKSSLGQSRVSGGPAAHPRQNFCSVHPPPPRVQMFEIPTENSNRSAAECSVHPISFFNHVEVEKIFWTHPHPIACHPSLILTDYHPNIPA